MGTTRSADEASLLNEAYVYLPLGPAHPRAVVRWYGGSEDILGVSDAYLPKGSAVLPRLLRSMTLKELSVLVELDWLLSLSAYAQRVQAYAVDDCRPGKQRNYMAFPDAGPDREGRILLRRDGIRPSGGIARDSEPIWDLDELLALKNETEAVWLSDDPQPGPKLFSPHIRLTREGRIVMVDLTALHRQCADA